VLGQCIPVYFLLDSTAGVLMIAGPVTALCLLCERPWLDQPGTPICIAGNLERAMHGPAQFTAQSQLDALPGALGGGMERMTPSHYCSAAWLGRTIIVISPADYRKNTDYIR
jgi:hypothetical protein